MITNNATAAKLILGAFLALIGRAVKDLDRKWGRERKEMTCNK